MKPFTIIKKKTYLGITELYYYIGNPCNDNMVAVQTVGFTENHLYIY